MGKKFTTEACQKICNILTEQENSGSLISNLEKLAETFDVSDDALKKLRKAHVLDILKLLQEKETDSDVSKFCLDTFLESLRTCGLGNSKINISKCFAQPEVWIQRSLRKDISDFLNSSTHFYLIVRSPSAIITQGKIDQQLGRVAGHVHQHSASVFDCIKTLRESQDPKLIVSVICNRTEIILLPHVRKEPGKVILVTEEIFTQSDLTCLRVVEDEIKWSHLNTSLQEELLDRNVKVAHEDAEIMDSLRNVIQKDNIIVPLDTLVKGEFLQDLLSDDVIPTWSSNNLLPAIDCFTDFVAERTAFAKAEYGIEELTLLKKIAYCGMKVQFPMWAVHLKSSLWDKLTQNSYKELSKVGLVSEWSTPGVPRFLEKNVSQYFVARLILGFLKGDIQLEQEEEVNMRRFIYDEAFGCENCLQDIDHVLVSKCVRKNEILWSLVRDLLSRDDRVYSDPLQLMLQAIKNGKYHFEKLIALTGLKFDDHLEKLLSTALAAYNISAFIYITKHLVDPSHREALVNAKHLHDLLGHCDFNTVWKKLNCFRSALYSWESLVANVMNNKDTEPNLEVRKFLAQIKPIPQENLDLDPALFGRILDDINDLDANLGNEIGERVNPSCSSQANSSQNLSHITDVPGTNDNANSPMEPGTVVDRNGGNAGPITPAPNEMDSNEGTCPASGETQPLVKLVALVDYISQFGEKGNENTMEIDETLLLTSLPDKRLCLPNLKKFKVHLTSDETLDDGSERKNFVKEKCNDLRPLLFFDKNPGNGGDALRDLIRDPVNISLHIAHCLCLYANHEEGKLVLNMLKDAQCTVDAWNCDKFPLKTLLVNECNLNSVRPAILHTLEVVVFRRVTGLRNQANLLQECSNLKEMTWIDFGNRPLNIGNIIHRNPKLKKIALSNCHIIRTPTESELVHCDLEELYMHNCVYDETLFKRFRSTFPFLEKIVFLGKKVDSHDLDEIMGCKEVKSVWVWRLKIRKESPTSKVLTPPSDRIRDFLLRIFSGVVVDLENMAFEVNRTESSTKSKVSRYFGRWAGTMYSDAEMDTTVGMSSFEHHQNNVFFF